MTIVLLVSAERTGATPQLQPDDQQCTRSNIYGSGQVCTVHPNDACKAVCEEKLMGKDGQCEDGACMCTFCSPWRTRPFSSRGLIGHN
ncbi:hypothetical protein BS78_05G114500 [Paspalum vaginatum]|nr:hypothetical protein BS78_05G114500 [Paspalum vaginatum]